jgi:hypothetical protein
MREQRAANLRDDPAAHPRRSRPQERLPGLVRALAGRRLLVRIAAI